jgi:hypothetical protein
MIRRWIEVIGSRSRRAAALLRVACIVANDYSRNECAWSVIRTPVFGVV